MANQRGKRARAPRQTPFWRRTSTLMLGTVVVVIVAVVAFIVIAHLKSTNSGGSDVASPAVVRQVAGVSPQVLKSVGTGGYQNPLKTTHSGSTLKGSGGKPEVLYVGAEYCPFCAAERWSVIVALGRFGKFSNLHYTTSSSQDVYPNTPTFTFYGSTYKSKYIDFASVETTTRNPNKPLQNPTSQQNALMQKYDAPPYVQDRGSIPFIDVANHYVATGSGYDPNLLANKTQKQIAGRLANPKDPLTRGIVANANYLTAAICESTGNKPAKVCSKPPIPQVQKKLGK